MDTLKKAEENRAQKAADEYAEFVEMSLNFLRRVVKPIPDYERDRE